MKYKIHGKNIVVFSSCKIIPENALASFPKTPGSLYTYEKIKNNNILLYEISADIVREIKKIEKFYEYKIVPYQSCVLHSINQINFVYQEEMEDCFIITCFGEKQITIPTRVEKSQYENIKEKLFNTYKNILGVSELKVILSSQIPVRWDTPVEFLFPETIQYREKIKKRRETTLSLAINISLAGIGAMFLLLSFVDFMNTQKEYLKVQTQYRGLKDLKEKVITHTYRDRIAEKDKTEVIIPEILKILKNFPRSEIEKIEFDLPSGTLKAIIVPDSVANITYQNIEKIFQNAKIELIYAENKVKYQITEKIRSNENEIKTAFNSQ